MFRKSKMNQEKAQKRFYINNKPQIQPLVLNEERNSFSQRKRNIHQHSEYYILNRKMDSMESQLKNIRTDISNLGEIIRSSFIRLENLLKERLPSKSPKRAQGNKITFQFKKKRFEDIKLTDDKKEIQNAKDMVQQYSDKDESFKVEYNDSRTENHSNYSQFAKSVSNLSNASNKNISSPLGSNSKNENHQMSENENTNSIRRRYIQRNSNSGKRKSN